ncbi:hypothetical protein ACH9EU_08470 [Kocuria sp. M1R5S2]|uniref:hypothetical protein n=1 Tax=Kocuria rhizosphaerae TaxID=3376285 RepID=UPI0037A937A6
MTTTDPTAPAFDGTRRSMYEMGFHPFGQWWSTLPTGAQIALVLGFVVAMVAAIWWAVRHERRHTPAPQEGKRPKRAGPGRSASPGS